MMEFCYPGGISQKSVVYFTGWLVHNNPCCRAATSLTFAIMHRSRVRYFIEFIIHALFWIGVYYALKALTSASYSMVNYTDGGTQRMDVRILFAYSWIVLGSLMILFYSNTFWLFKKVIRYKSDLARVAVIAGWFALIFFMNYLLINTLIGPSGSNHQPQKMSFVGIRSDTALLRPHQMTAFPGPPPRFGESPADNWLHMQLIIALVFLAVLAIAAANFFMKEWIRNDLRRSQAEAQQLSTEIRLLRSQVNPHFLFNTLNNLFSMAQRKGHEELADGISKLSGMMRYMIYESNTDTVPLQREIAYLEDCIALNKLRYAHSEVAVSFRHPAAAVAGGIFIAPMLFVPFLENAFKHGVSIGSHSRITMDISVEQKKLIFTCENTDHSAVKKLETGKGGIGLENVRRRLELVYPGRHELKTGPSAGKYTVNLQIELA
jgi:two-component system LytT family sensor kinase